MTVSVFIRDGLVCVQIGSTTAELTPKRARELAATLQAMARQAEVQG